jgi:iron transport multicopper oxidase
MGISSLLTFALSLAGYRSGIRSAATVTYEWDVTWVNAAPDGFARPVIGINGQWPCPPIHANLGDTIIVKLNNRLGNETTGLHFHGLSQLNTEEMDGASGATQCPVPPGSSIIYKFLVCCSVLAYLWMFVN